MLTRLWAAFKRGDVKGKVAVLTAIALAGVALVAVPAAASAASRSIGLTTQAAPDRAAPDRIAPARAAAPALGRVAAAVPPAPPPWAGLLPPGLTGTLLTDGVCQYMFNSVPCHDVTTGHGWFNPFDECYWLAVGNPGPSGTTYNRTCESPGGLISATAVTSSQAPPGYAPNLIGNLLTTLTVVAKFNGFLAPLQATEPNGYDPAHPPTPTPAGLVGLPVWLWAAEGPLVTFLDKLGPFNLNLKFFGISVTASLLNQQLLWTMGNGDVVDCQSIGAPFNPTQPAATPTCGYTYAKPGTYVVDARSIWFITIGIPLLPAVNVLVVRDAIPQTISINELQVVTQ